MADLHRAQVNADLARELAHQINNHLARVVGGLELLSEDECLTDEQRASLSDIQTAASLMTRDFAAIHALVRTISGAQSPAEQAP